MNWSKLQRYWVISGPGAAAAAWAAMAIAPRLMSASSVHGYQLGAAAAAVVAAWALYRFVANIRRDRLVADTPLAKIRSAAQGYVKVFGRARPSENSVMEAPLSARACVWWSYSIEERVRGSREENSWHLIDSGSSVEPFVLADADAECLIGPVNAEITPTARDVWYGNTVRPSGPPELKRSIFAGGNFRYTEQLLRVGDPLSVTGELRSESALNGADGAAPLVHQWKQDQRALLARFDRNRDGRLDEAEWEAVRLAAAAEAKRNTLQAAVARTSVIGQPTHGEPFLIASMDAAHLVRREQWHAILFLAVGLIFAVLSALALERSFALRG